MESSAQSATLAQMEAESKVSINSEYLKSAQGIHAMAIFILPLLGAFYAFWVGVEQGFQWFDVTLMLVLYSITMLGITVGFHRCFTHRAFKAGRLVTFVLGVMGSMAAQGSLIYWVSNHRRHHMYSDKPGDTHSPHVNLQGSMNRIQGLFYAQIGYTFSHTITNTLRFSKDLYRNDVCRFVNKYYYVWVALGLVIPAMAGALYYGTLDGAFRGFLWGGLVRLFFSYHFINSLNSFLHVYGKRSFDTNEYSHNNGLLAIPTFGEGWHNNHHAFPNSAQFGHSFLQLDMGWWVIWGLEKFNLVHDVRRPNRSEVVARSISVAEPAAMD